MLPSRPGPSTKQLIPCRPKFSTYKRSPKPRWPLEQHNTIPNTSHCQQCYNYSGTNDDEQRGTSYVRWGRKTCNGNATLVYEGKPMQHIHVCSLVIFSFTSRHKLLDSFATDYRILPRRFSFKCLSMLFQFLVLRSLQRTCTWRYVLE